VQQPYFGLKVWLKPAGKSYQERQKYEIIFFFYKLYSTGRAFAPYITDAEVTLQRLLQGAVEIGPNLYGVRHQIKIIDKFEDNHIIPRNGDAPCCATHWQCEIGDWQNTYDSLNKSL